MQDTQYCPMCGEKMRTKKEESYVHILDKISDFIERTCVGMNHVFQIVIDSETEKVDLIKISLQPDYSKFILIDYLHQKCKVICLKNNIEQSFEIPKMLYPDFPDLKGLKEKVDLFITFS